MKRITAIVLFTLSTLGASTAILAQEQVLKVTVPFAFAAGDKVLPADTYTVRPMSGFVLIQSVDKHFSAITLGSHANNDPTGGSKLIFNRYGDEYFLRRILCPTTAAMNVDIPTSKREKRVRSNEASPNRGELALLGFK
jgi:hypothetical protein